VAPSSTFRRVMFMAISFVGSATTDETVDGYGKASMHGIDCIKARQAVCSGDR
jgi:hypothetical protein